MIDTNSATWRAVAEWASARLKTHAGKVLTHTADPAQVPQLTARIDELKELLALDGSEKPAVAATFVKRSNA